VLRSTWCCHQHSTHLLVGAIGTVEFSVAAPLGCHAVLLRALELLDGIALLRCALGLVRSITTVVVAVADPALLDASAVVARELVRAARVICGRVES
jgi:hypothetical protein